MFENFKSIPHKVPNYIFHIACILLKSCFYSCFRHISSSFQFSEINGLSHQNKSHRLLLNWWVMFQDLLAPLGGSTPGIINLELSQQNLSCLLVSSWETNNQPLSIETPKSHISRDQYIFCFGCVCDTLQHFHSICQLYPWHDCIL